MNHSFKTALSCLITSTLALHASDAAACTVAPPPVCKPVLASGASVPRNLPGLFMKHQSAGASLPPSEFFSIAGGSATLALHIETPSEGVSHPLYLARIVGGSAVDFGAPGARTVTVPRCNFGGEPITTGTTEEKSASFPITVTEAAALPASVQPTAVSIQFSVAPKNNGANCGGATEMGHAGLELALPADLLPWLDVMTWQLSKSVIWNGQGVMPLAPVRLSPIEVRINEARTGISFGDTYDCGGDGGQWGISGIGANLT